MRFRAIGLALCAFALVLAAPALAAGVLDEYQARYQKAEWASQKEEIVKELAATGRVEAVKAIHWCQERAKDQLDAAREASDKVQAKLLPIRAKYEAAFHKWFEDEKKQGREPDVTRPPQFPEYADFLAASAEVARVERHVTGLTALLQSILDVYGDLVAKLPPAAQSSVQADWTKTHVASKDWTVRAEIYEILGHVPTAWALDMSVAAVTTESDPRALVAAVDALAGKDPLKATGPLIQRVDDVRWLVRAAVVAALERTPTKEGIDALVARMQKEDGRLRDDCCRALRALTGEPLPPNPEMWRIYWTNNRATWQGKPAAVREAPAAAAGAPVAAEKRTGFFGLEIESRRVVFVIDVSGSMTWEMGGKGPDAKTSRAVRAKEELKTCLAGLEDGVRFDIVFFSAGVRIWKPEMQVADPRTRKEAREFVDAAEVMGGTNTYDALEAAFSLGDIGKGRKREADPTGEARVDTIVFLSDGKPSLGRTTEPDEIRAAVRSWNKARRVAIHAVAFGVNSMSSGNAKDGADPKFMQGLANDTGGSYREF